MLSGVASAVPLSNSLIYCDDDAGRLFTLDPGNGSVGLIGTMPVVMNDIAFNLAGELYGVSGSLAAGSNVYRVDPTTAATVYIGHTASFLNALAFRDDGTLFGAGNALYTSNTQTGASTLIGGLGSYGSGGDLAFNTSGILFLTTNDDLLVKVNPSTGATTYIGALGFSDVWGLAFGQDGVLRGVSNTTEELIQINVQTGHGSLIADFTGHGTTGAYGADRWRGSLPGLAINDVTLTEGNSGTKLFNFTVSLTGSNPSGVSVNYATADGTATTADNDYVARSGALTWAAGDTSARTVGVTVNGDLKLEPDETFYVNLSSSTGAAIADDQGVGTVRDEDGIIYACDSGGRLFTLDPRQGNVGLIGTMPAVMTDIAFNAQGELFGVSGTAVTGSDLYRINPNTAAATSVGHVGPFVNAHTFRNDGTLFAAGDSLVTINTTTGSSTMEYSLGVTYRSAGNLLNPVAADTYRDIVTITISVT